MLKFFQLILLISIFTNMAWSDFCPSNYNCTKKINKKTRIYNLNCTLPNMNTFPITAPNVLNTDGTLKTYFETKNTVCDVLGWMNGAVPFMEKHYGGMNMQVSTPLSLF